MHIRRRSQFEHIQNTIPADAIFCQLCADIAMARDVEQRIKSGLVAPKHLDDVKELERRAWLHMANYMAVRAFVDDEDGDPA